MQLQCAADSTPSIHVRQCQWVERAHVSSLHAMLHPASFQRNVQRQQVADIVKYLQRFPPNERPSLGVITVAHLGDKTYCVDGQHRLYAYLELERGDQPILVLHHTVATFAEVRALFAAVNQCIAVPDFLLTEEFAGRQMVVKQVCRMLQNAYRPFFVHKASATTRRPNRPRLRPHKLEDHLFRSAYVQQTVDRIGSTTEAAVTSSSQQITSDIQALNAALALFDTAKLHTILAHFEPMRYGEAAAAVGKFATRVKQIGERGACAPFYLGLFADYTWLTKYQDVCAVVFDDGAEGEASEGHEQLLPEGADADGGCAAQGDPLLVPSASGTPLWVQ